MRMSRTLIAALAFALIGLVPFTASSASAAPEVSAAGVTAAAVAERPSAAAKRQRNVSIKFKQLSRRSFKFVGNVKKASNKRVILVRSNSANGKYRNFLKLRTKKNGRYETRGLSKTGFYAIKVPSDKRFKTSFSKVIRVYYL